MSYGNRGYTPRLFLEADEYCETYLTDVLLTDRETGRARTLTDNVLAHFRAYAYSLGVNAEPILTRNGVN